MAAARKDFKAEREQIESAIQLQPFFVDGWAALYAAVRREVSEDAAIAAVEELGATPAHVKNAAPYIALQSFYAEGDATREAFKEILDVALWRLQQLAPEALRPQVVAAGDDMDRVVELLRGACVRVPVISWE